MDFRVFVVIEAPILDKKYELFVPVDRRIHDLITLLKKTLPELSRDYYAHNFPNIYNKSTGKVYDLNLIIDQSDIKMGTRLILL